METAQQKIERARARRETGLAKLEPKLAGLPAQLPRNSLELPGSILTAREIELTEKYDVVELLAILKAREVSVEEVTRAFLRRAAVAHAATNCLVELMWDQAIARAKHLDSLPEPQGAFFGLPISTKEHHGMVGENVITTASVIAWVDRKHGSNTMYDDLWEEGCVFYARTTQPQTIMHLETVSNLWGRTDNPYNRDLTAGGSSGGESALIAMRGSLELVVTSVAVFAALPHLLAFMVSSKPSTKRITVAGQTGHMAGRETIFSTPGPMTVDRKAMELLMRVILSKQPWRKDPSIVPMPWTPYNFTKPLKIAVQWWDGVVKPHPPITRALKEVAAACQKAGMRVVDWDCEKLDHKKSWDIISALYWPDGGLETLDCLEGAGDTVLPLTKWIIQEQPSVKNMTQLCYTRDAYRTSYAKTWNATADDDGDEVDVILCPASFGAATPHEKSKYWGYTAHWNMLDYPGVVFPVTSVDASKDTKDLNYKPINEQDQFIYDLYDPELFAGAPVGLQIVGRRLQEEKVLAALELVEQAMGRK
ncbi:acetamidase [Cordyceps javanica]|uniref:Acetamidase n=1 Tax=Cordyceps javanica TaxID=43265 RepID=A0A545W8A7_9HYPO|nr:acetamidase [Cordyceps javanica]TQW10207.1 acetamidase [Cordyceps javanica]